MKSATLRLFFHYAVYGVFGVCALVCEVLRVYPFVGVMGDVCDGGKIRHILLLLFRSLRFPG